MTKKFILLLLFVTPLCSLSIMAGGLMTNTNYHIAFDRMFARGATSEIDAAYSNPAGLAWGHEGWQLSLNFQKPWQNRDIKTTVPNLGINHKYEGKASAPIVPALFASYKKDRWAISTMIGIVGSGGFVKYDEGVPMFTVPITALLAQNGVMPNQHTINAQMKGKQYVYGGQLNFTYKIADCWSAAVGMRANYYDGYYRGHVVSTLNTPPVELVGLHLDCDQRGWGFNPIVSVNYHKDKLTLSARYEFRTKINVPNKTHQLEANIIDPTSLATGTPSYLPPAAVMAQFGDKVAAYQDGVKTRYDLPALVVAAIGYEFKPNLRAAAEFHFFYDKNAKMANNRQKELKHGTYEILAGLEWDINEKFTVSCGGQRTDYGLSDNYQTHTSFACDSYSLGFGGAFNINKHLRLNASYFCTLYSDYTKNVPAANPGGYQGTTLAGQDVFSRTNHVIGLGIDYKF